jgi:hypothetical protein
MIVGSSTGFPLATYAFPTAYAGFDKTVERSPKHSNGADQTHSVADLTTGCVINLMHLWRTLRKIILPAVLAVLQLSIEHNHRPFRVFSCIPHENTLRVPQSECLSKFSFVK